MVVGEDTCSFKMVVREVENGGERGIVFQANADYNDWLYTLNFKRDRPQIILRTINEVGSREMCSLCHSISILYPDFCVRRH